MRNMIWSGRYLSIVVLLFALLSCEEPPPVLPTQAKLELIPQPTQLESRAGFFSLAPAVFLTHSDDFSTQGQLLQNFLQVLGIQQKSNAKSVIELAYGFDKQAAESYRLEISQDSVRLTANAAEGISRGIATLQQLLLLNEHQGNYFLPQLKLFDRPQFRHRGLLLDCARHFFEVEVVKKYIDLLAFYKMNTLHWHLTEDQGWRIAIDRYPELTGLGAYRTELDGSSYGDFYSKADIREVVAYATARNIKVIPEIELPGHSQAAIAAYPHLSCTGDTVPVANDWGVFKEIYCAGNDSVFTFLEEVLTEVMELFPSQQIHIGGDEAPKVRWEHCPKCQRRMAENGLKDEAELQSYFIRRIQAFLKANGRELIGWDEILEGGLAEGAIVQSWRGMEGGIEAVKHGHQAIMSPNSHAYFDYALDAIDVEKVYRFEPVPKGLTAEEASLILGGECNLWSERVPDEKTLDSRVFPRLLAMTEVLWSDSSQKDFQAFNQRLQAHYPLLDFYEVKYGEESVPMSHEITLEEQSTYVSLIPYSPSIELSYQFACADCDSTFWEYVKPIKVDRNSTLRVQPYKNRKKYGEIMEIPFAVHQAINAEVDYQSRYSKWYKAGGKKGLVDGKLGSLNFRDGSWQGFWGNDAEFILELEKEVAITSVSANFYQYNNSWIFIPQYMEVAYSSDGKSWKKLGRAERNIYPRVRGKYIDQLSIPAPKDVTCRYLKVKVKNLGKVPTWHEAAGSDAWIFMDEIIVQ